MPPAKYRTIVEEFNFENQLKLLVQVQTPRVEEFVEGVKWLLTRNPQGGRQISNTEVWFLANEYQRDQKELPVVIYYTFDDNFVNLLSIVESLYPPKK